MHEPPYLVCVAIESATAGFLDRRTWDEYGPFSTMEEAVAFMAAVRVPPIPERREPQ